MHSSMIDEKNTKVENNPITRLRVDKRLSSHETAYTKRRGCICKKAECLKLYCECFSSGSRCGTRCQCSGCKNREHNRVEIAHAIQVIEKRSQKCPTRSPRSTYESSVMSNEVGKYKTPIRNTSAVCACKDGICTSECPCLVISGECRTNCPCLGCQALQEKKKGCSCKKSNCLKLYCECLAAQTYCDSRCHCEGCKNTASTERDRNQAISSILERNPSAFRPKVVTNGNEANSLHHLRGCNCRKSNCLKNYCECHQAGVACTNRCACHKCFNTDEFYSAKKMLILSAVAKKETPACDLVPGGASRSRRHSRQLSFDDSPASCREEEPSSSHLQRKRSFEDISCGKNGTYTLGKASSVPKDATTIFLKKIYALAFGDPPISHTQCISSIRDLTGSQSEDVNAAASLQHFSQPLLDAVVSPDAKVESNSNSQLEVGSSAANIDQQEQEDFVDTDSSLICQEGSIDLIDPPVVEKETLEVALTIQARTERAVLQAFYEFVGNLSDEC